MLGYQNYSPPSFVSNKNELKTSKELQLDETIFVIKPDEGTGVVILNRSDYFQKMANILKDLTKFAPLSADPTKITIMTIINRTYTLESEAKKQ